MKLTKLQRAALEILAVFKPAHRFYLPRDPRPFNALVKLGLVLASPGNKPGEKTIYRITDEGRRALAPTVCQACKGCGRIVVNGVTRRRLCRTCGGIGFITGGT